MARRRLGNGIAIRTIPLGEAGLIRNMSEETERRGARVVQE